MHSRFAAASRTGWACLVTTASLAGAPQIGLELHPSTDGVQLAVPTGIESGLQRLETFHPGYAGTWLPIALQPAGSEWSPLTPHFPTILQNPAETQIFDHLQSDLLYRLVQYPAPILSERAQAARFLRQSTFGPRRQEIDSLAQSGLDYEAWMETQFSLPPTLHSELSSTIEMDSIFSAHHKGIVWTHAAIDAPDQLRQRMAWALAQIFVVSEIGGGNRAELAEWTNYYDIFVAHAFGNYREVMQRVTMNPKMGRYLTYVNNKKATETTFPDENYAREVMQLFTIGLWLLHPDGRPLLDPQGNLQPTYDNQNVESFARAFTGLRKAPDEAVEWIADMVVNESRHDTAPKLLLDGSFLPAGQSTMEDINAVLDHLFNHPNTPPFVSRLLIQRMTGSNPTPAYLGRVADIFRDNGSGVRGDLQAVLKAILLDPEARNTHILADDALGRVQEPLLAALHVARSFHLQAMEGDCFFIKTLDQLIGQHPYRSPSVFNFYLPDYQEPGEVTDRHLYAPEFQVINDSSIIHLANLIHTLVHHGMMDGWNNRKSPTALLDLSYEEGLAADADQLLAHLSEILTNGLLEAETRASIQAAVEAVPVNDPGARVKAAISLIAITPEFYTLR